MCVILSLLKPITISAVIAYGDKIHNMYFFGTTEKLKPTIRKSTIENAHDVLVIGDITIYFYFL